MQSDPNGTLDLEGKECYNAVDIKPSKDVTKKLSLPAEKMLKRFEQLGSGLFYVIVMDGEPVMLFVGGKIEVLRKIPT